MVKFNKRPFYDGLKQTRITQYKRKLNWGNKDLDLLGSKAPIKLDYADRKYVRHKSKGVDGGGCAANNGRRGSIDHGYRGRSKSVCKGKDDTRGKAGQVGDRKRHCSAYFLHNNRVEKSGGVVDLRS